MQNNIESLEEPIDSSNLLELRGATKSFGSNLVLDNINFELKAGEIHALVGENGAGKSTCLGLIYGLHQSDSGFVTLNEKTVKIDSPSHAQKLGVGCVFQELSLANSLSVSENIFAGRSPSRYGMVNWKSLNAQAEKLLKQFELDINVTLPVGNLPISTRQLVEIAKALSLNSKILLLDEPTSALTPDEVSTLFTVLKKLTKQGIGIVYVSHHMSEIFKISDRITTLRDGKVISTKRTSDTSQEKVVAEMIGSQSYRELRVAQPISEEILLSVDNLSNSTDFSGITFNIRKGEILGIAGLMGSGRSEIVRTIAGLKQDYAGSIIFKGNPVTFNSLREAMSNGIGFIPEERKTEGLFLQYPLDANFSSANLKNYSKLEILQHRKISSACQQAIDFYQIKTESYKKNAGALSGGNQQKLMLAKWLERQPDLLIIEEPTKGVDVGAKFQIHKELRARAQEGMSVIIISSDFPELISLSNRILVVSDGNLMGELSPEKTSEEQLLQLAVGLKKQSQNENTISEK